MSSRSLHEQANITETRHHTRINLIMEMNDSIRIIRPSPHRCEQNKFQHEKKNSNEYKIDKAQSHESLTVELLSPICDYYMRCRKIVILPFVLVTL